MFETPHSKSLNPTLPSSPRMYFAKIDNQEPLILNVQRYNKLFHEIYKNNQRMASYNKNQQQEQKRASIKESILRKLDRQGMKKSFDAKFNRKKTNKVLMKSNPEETELERQQKCMKLYFSDRSNVITLWEECKLLELFLQDEQKIKTNTDYLKNLSKTSHHRRSTISKNQSEKIYLTHIEKQYFNSKRLKYIKHDKFFETSLTAAKKNITYKKQKTYQASLYAMNQGFQNLLQSKQLIIQKNQQFAFNKLMKLFLNFAYSSEVQKTYYEYIAKQDFPKLCKFINNLNSKIKLSVIEQMIKIITEHKQSQRLNFQDFNELIERINQLQNQNILEDIYIKHPSIFQYKIPTHHKRQNIIDLKQQVMGALKRQKLIVAFKIMFYNQRQKLISDKYLSVRHIIDIFKRYQIVPKIIWNQKMFMNCMWVQRRRQGLNFQQLIQAIVNVGLDFEKWQSFIKALRERDLGKYLLG